MPEARLSQYARFALQSRGIDPDAHLHLEGDAPPAEGLTPELEARLRALGR